MLTKKTPLLITAGLLVVGASVFGAVSANAASNAPANDAPTVADVSGPSGSVQSTPAETGQATDGAAWTKVEGDLVVSGAPGTAPGDFTSATTAD